MNYEYLFYLFRHVFPIILIKVTKCTKNKNKSYSMHLNKKIVPKTRIIAFLIT